MNELEYIKFFYNFIYSSEPIINRSFNVSYEQFEAYKNWLVTHNIYIPSMQKINRSMFELSKGLKDYKKLDSLLKIDLKDELKNIKEKYQNMTHIIMVNTDYKIEHDGPLFYLKVDNEPSYLTDDILPCFTELLFHIDELPGILVFTKGKQKFVKLHNEEDLQFFKEHYDHIYDLVEEDYSYYVHLSDLHLGPNRKYRSLEALYESLNRVTPMFKTKNKLKFIITGDLMNSPNEKAMYLANDFMFVCKKHYKADVTFVFGNHDMMPVGLGFAPRSQPKAVAYLLGEKIKVLEDDKVILIKIDSNMNGNFARGKIGKRQLAEIEYELSTVEHLEDYTIVAMLHHHVYPVTKADFIKRKWNEKFIFGKLMDSSKALIDSKYFITWLEDHHIHYVVHGHKHIPFVLYKNNCHVISAGSATGSLKESESRYLSYNILKYKLSTKTFVSAHIIYKDKKESERLRIESYLLEDES